MSSEAVGGLGTLWTVGRGSRWGWQRSAARWRSDDGTLGGDYAIGWLGAGAATVSPYLPAWPGPLYGRPNGKPNGSSYGRNGTISAIS